MAISLDEANKFLAAAVAPLVTLDSEAGTIRFVEQLGWTMPLAPSGFALVGDSAFQLLNLLGEFKRLVRQKDTAGAQSKLVEVVSFVGVVIGNIENLPASVNGELPAEFRDTTQIGDLITKRVLDFVLCTAIAANFPAVKALLFTLGIIDETEFPADDSLFQPDFTLREFSLDRLKLLFTDQAELLRQTYGWGTHTLDQQRIFEAVEQLSFALISRPITTYPSAAFLSAMFPGVPVAEGSIAMLAIPLLSGFGVFPLKLGVLPAPTATPDEQQGLALRLLGAPSLDLSVPLSSTLALDVKSELTLDAGVGVLLRPDRDPTIIQNVDNGGTPAAEGSATLEVRREDAENAIPIIDFGGGSELSMKSFFTRLGLHLGPPDISLDAGIEGGVLQVSLGEADGFLRSVVPSDSLRIEFDIGLGWSKRRGLFITGSAGFETLLVLNLTFGPVELQTVRLRVRVSDEGLRMQAGLGVSVTLGPIVGVVEGLGVESLVKFESGNLGPVDLRFGFLFPSGIGISIDAGAVKGGGFLSFDNDAGRYSGVIELQVFSVSVKAFGLLETKFPDGTQGYSFVIVIIAEFVPIQLGFGFTLLGIGGLIGVNRTMDETALAAAVRTGALANLLFPLNPIQDAPAIINDLATVFPAAPGHYLFGPMAKLGWGTPTLISADLGIILEFPGPRIAVLGVVRMLLPSPDAAIVRFQLAVAGILDFPAQTFSLLASLFDSTVAGYVVTGDMAYRLGFGNNPSFLLSVGGFNAGFQSPPAFPTLRRASVDLGVSGNPSLTASGYFAITSNTAQIGASIQLKASGFGIRLDGWLGFDVLFVFSPFSFTASISAGVRISFHGAGFGITLRGSLSGPTPWHVNGRVCVSILWWDACLPIDVKFGRAEPAALPEIDPWDGDESVGVIGLRAAIENTGNWAGSPPPGGLAVVALSAAATAATTPVDPIGAATLRQKVAPLNMVLEKFGEYKPAIHDQFHLSATRGSVSLNLTPVTEIGLVEDKFAPAHYLQLSSAQRLSMPSYDDMDAGISIAPDRVRPGSMESRTLEYVTKFIDAQGETHDDNEPRFRVTQDQLKHFLERSAAALGGVRRSGIQRYMHPGRDKKISLRPPRFVVADACSLTPNNDITATGTTRTQALLALRAHLQNNPQDRGRFTIAPAA
jgi:hypothetical protein